jgi:hemerythrin-like metal-binding protein
MALLEWNESLSVNIKAIDEQHQKLVGILNSLYDAMRAGKSKEVLGVILDELVNYAVYHFNTEEELMTKFEFPLYDEHFQEHSSFKAKAADLVSRYENSTAIISIEVINFLRDWVNTHILDTDKKYQVFLNEHGVF